MQGILLDTNVLSELMRPAPEPKVIAWFLRQDNVRLWTSAITKAEILLGVALLPDGKRRSSLETAAQQMFEEDFGGCCLPFDDRAAEIYPAVVLGRRRSGLATTTEDAQLASIALSHHLPLATRNVRDFQKIEGLTVINPWDDG